MTVIELIIKDEPIVLKWKSPDNIEDAVKMEAYFGYDVPRAIVIFDRGQTHMLYLFLKDKFKFD